MTGISQRIRRGVQESEVLSHQLELSVARLCHQRFQRMTRLLDQGHTGRAGRPLHCVGHAKQGLEMLRVAGFALQRKQVRVHRAHLLFQLAEEGGAEPRGQTVAGFHFLRLLAPPFRRDPPTRSSSLVPSVLRS